MLKYLSAYDNFTAVNITSNEKYSLAGKIADVDVFVNLEQDKNLIIVGRSGSLQHGGILIADKEIDITDTINWTGKIFDMGINAKCMYENIKVGILSELPRHKRLLFKFFSKKF